MIKTFRIVALLEGISFILLLFVAVPIKYLGNDPQFVKLLGMPHGLLFVAYVAFAVLLNSELKWSKKTLTAILLAALIPFGTFYIDRKHLRTT